MGEPLFRTDDLTIWRIVDTETPGCLISDTFPNACTSAITDQKDLLFPRYIDPDGNLIMAIQSFLVKYGNSLILVDGSIGNGKARYTHWADRLRTGFLENLKSTGFSESDIMSVLSTHLHTDHVGWFTRLHENRWVPTFPNARYYFVKPEYEYWKTAVNPGDLDTNIALLDSVEPVVHSGLAEFVPPDFALTENVYLEPAPGHTPGYVLVHLKSGGNHVVFVGDIFHHPAQIGRPDLTADRYDCDIGKARETRRRFLEKYTNSGTIVIGSHFASCPAGLIEDRNGTRIFCPVG